MGKNSPVCFFVLKFRQYLQAVPVLPAPHTDTAPGVEIRSDELICNIPCFVVFYIRQIPF